MMNAILKAKLSIAFALGYQILLVVLIAVRPDLPVYSTTISEWAIGKYGWLMQLAFILSALSYFSLFLFLRHEISSASGKWGLALLLACATGTIVVGLFVTDPYPPDFTLTTTVIHTIGGTLGMILFPAAALLLSFQLAKRWTNSSSILKLLAFLPVIAFAGFIIHLNLFVIPMTENSATENLPIGYPPRIMFLTYHLWLITIALLFIKNHSQPNIS